MNEKIFAAIMVILAGTAVAILPGAAMPAADIVTLKLLYIALLLSVIYGLLHFLRGTKCDIQAEIFDENNLAGAVFVGSIIIALAMVIGK